MLIITGGKVFKDGNFVEGMDVLLEGDKIVDIVPQGQCKDGEVIDVKGNYVCPGFVDIHIHGCQGYDTMNGTEEALVKMAKFVASHGTTSFLPTTMTNSTEDIQRSLKAISDLKGKFTGGAEILGSHLEGPFISAKAKGAQPEQFILAPQISNFESHVGECGDVIKTLTMAPEIEGADELIKYLTNKGIVVSVGHTSATYEECVKGFEYGISHTTHFYNAMTVFKSREPGVVGAVLDNPDVTLEVIADLVHSHPVSVKLAYNVKGPERMVLITDAMEATGLGDGQYVLGGQDVFVKNGEARLKEGNLAGSTLTQDKALQNVVKIGIPLEDGIKMLTETPARVIGVNCCKGSIKKGYDADIVVLDSELSVAMTIVKGNKVAG